MTSTARQNVTQRSGILLTVGGRILAACLLAAGPAWAWVDLENDIQDRFRDAPSGVFITDGSFVMNVGELHMHITNWGLIGSEVGRVTQYSEAPSAQWPAGSGDEYLYSAGLWVGGVLLGERLVSTGEYQNEILPLYELEDTIYEAISGNITRPPGNDLAGGKRYPESGADDDEDGVEDEEIINGYDEDEDFRIDEDFAQIGNQMFVCTMYDNTRLSQEFYPDHTPLNLQIVQQSYAWENDNVDDFIGFEFIITNIGVTTIDNVYIGFFADCDIGPRGQGGIAEDDMAGSFEGMVRASDGSFVPISVGYMYDAAEGNRLDGYIGMLFLGHDIDPTGRRAPQSVALRSFNSFSGQSSFDQGGDPTNDAERYELLSGEERDPNTQPGKENDFRILVSAGPFSELESEAQLQFQAAFVIGSGLEGLQRNCAEAALTWYGNYYNRDGSDQTGVLGRESKLCREWFTGNEDLFDQFIPDVMDTTCVDQQWALDQPRLDPDDVFVDEDGHCAYFNLDNCFECARQVGEPCTAEGREIEEGRWNCNDPEIPDDEKAGCTGIAGNEWQVHWLVGMAPPPPGMRLWPADNRVHIFWDDVSENAKDIRLDTIDFESYRIWRADNWQRPFGSSIENGPESGLWQMIAEYDIVNHYVQVRDIDGVIYTDTLPLGANTSLEAIRYSPVVLDTDRYPHFTGLADSMQVAVDSDVNGTWGMVRPPLDDPGMQPVMDWIQLNRNASGAYTTPEQFVTVLDTYYAVTPREGREGEDGEESVVPKRAVQFYELIDRDIHNGFIYFYSVTATDHSLDLFEGGFRVIGAGQSGDPGSSFENTVPGAEAQTAENREKYGVNIYVFPNPATRDALEEFQQLYPNSDDPTGVRVMFTNLPAAKNYIKVYTLDGDLVAEIDHDGNDGYGQASWNLVSRNGQEVVSGIYLYTVQSEDDRFDDFIGKFVIIR